MLQGIAASLEGWAVQVKREKAIYHTLNKFSVDVTRKVRPPSVPRGCLARSCVEQVHRVLVLQLYQHKRRPLTQSLPRVG